MKISTSILSIKENKIENIKKIGNTSTDYIHLDIMDGLFVPNKVDFINELDVILETKKLIDIHLMVEDVENYIEKYKIFNPSYITFHLEVDKDVMYLINKIKKICKVGISIKPNTNIETLIPYLDVIDLVLIMSVEPGKGGQTFINSSVEKIEKLYEIREKNNYSFKIEVDGGVNFETIKNISKCDIAVVGSYITSSNDYEKQIRNLVI